VNAWSADSACVLNWLNPISEIQVGWLLDEVRKAYAVELKDVIQALSMVLSNRAEDDAMGRWIPQQPRVTVAIASRARLSSHYVWLYFRFCLSFRDIQEMMLERGVGSLLRGDSAVAFALWSGVRPPASAPTGSAGGTWHLDEVFCKITGELVYLWPRGRSKWRSARPSGAEAPGCESREAFLPQAAQRLSVCAACIVTDKLASYAGGKERFDSRRLRIIVDGC